ncbi:TNF15 factor, partial [Penelope pileata]|nr:TNF15 factor [Penelope pileata]
QVANERGSHFLKQRAVAAVMDTIPSAEKPRAHLTVKKQDLTSSGGGHLPVLQWEDKRGLAFTKNNLSYSSNSLVIPVSGDYYVYAQVTFRGLVENSYSRKFKNSNSVTAIITKVTDSYPEPTQLLTSTKTLSEEGNSWFQPIYLGAVVSLEVGDKLMVNVSDIKLVDYTKEYKTFFGAFLL